MFSNIIFAVLFAVAVQAHPDGAPLDACDTMTPLHEAYQPQSSPTPYTITMSTTNAAVGDRVIVSLSSAEGYNFQGFLMKALPYRVDSGVAGTFVNDLQDAHTLACSNVTDSAVTHNEASNKTSVTVTWSASEAGVYNFKATVVQYFETFWVAFYSQPITIQ